MRTATLAAAALLIAVPACADTTYLPGDKVRAAAMLHACAWEQYGRMLEFADARDQQAFVRYLLEQAMDGKCTLIDGGTVLTVEDVSLRRGATLVRADGDTQSWWVATKILGRGTKIGGPK